jgi:hypothetical protein
VTQKTVNSRIEGGFFGFSLLNSKIISKVIEIRETLESGWAGVFEEKKGT